MTDPAEWLKQGVAPGMNEVDLEQQRLIQEAIARGIIEVKDD